VTAIRPISEAHHSWSYDNMNRRSANIALYVNEPVDAEVGAQVLHPMTQLAILQFRPCRLVLRFLQFVFLLLEHAKRRLQQIVALRRVTFTLFLLQNHN